MAGDPEIGRSDAMVLATAKEFDDERAGAPAANTLSDLHNNRVGLMFGRKIIDTTGLRLSIDDSAVRKIQTELLAAFEKGALWVYNERKAHWGVYRSDDKVVSERHP